jgi:hypothetical protein
MVFLSMFTMKSPRMHLCFFFKLLPAASNSSMFAMDWVSLGPKQSGLYKMVPRIFQNGSILLFLFQTEFMSHISVSLLSHDC